jgi:hypothetical protein
MPPTVEPLAADETDRLVSSERSMAPRSITTAGDRLGDVHHVMIDKYTGQVDYAVMSFGGFLGIGESYHPLPWHKLTYDTGLGGYVVDIEARQLEAAPRYTASNRTGPTPAIAAASV